MASLWRNQEQRKLLPVLLALFLCLFPTWGVSAARHHRQRQRQPQPLRFGNDGEFKILQVADMHFSNGKKTLCEDVTRSQFHRCNDLNSTAFLRRLIFAESPDLIVYTGDNIFGIDVNDPFWSIDNAFEPAISSGIPWAAILGNHDQECYTHFNCHMMDPITQRSIVMKRLVGMKNTLSQYNPADAPGIEGFGNYNLEVYGARHTRFENKSVLNLYFLDTGDYEALIFGSYGWIKTGQMSWFERTSQRLQRAYMDGPEPQKGPAPGMVFMHIPLAEVNRFFKGNITGVRQERPSNGSVNSGFFASMVTMGDVKAVFHGHDHKNDFCGRLNGIHLCYAGGQGYHAYGKAGWDRRARVLTINLKKASLSAKKGRWGDVKTMRTWKRLDDRHLNPIDAQVLWYKGEPV